MLRLNAQVGRLVLLALLFTAAGCGSDHSTAAKKPDKDVLSCRGKWRSLGNGIEGHDTSTNPSALAPRWGSITGAVQHYSASATAKDCGTTLEEEKKSVAALAAFGARLAPYDMELRLSKVKDAAQTYASTPTPMPPSPSASSSAAPRPAPSRRATPRSNPSGSNPPGQGNKHKPAPTPPAPSVVAAALRTLTTQARLATAQQAPGWQQARSVDIADSTAVAKAVKDLAFLSTQSSAYRASTAALVQISTALRASGS